MLLTNLTIVESGQKHMLGEGKTKGAILENIFGMFTYFKTNTTFDFVSNIFANVSSLAAGRRFLIDNNMLTQILDVVLDNANCNEHRRKHLLATIRNICFEYEDYEIDFDKLDLLGKLIKLLVQEQGIAMLPEEWKSLEGTAPKELFQSQISMDNTREILDGIILLVNADRFLKKLQETHFSELLKCIKCPNFGETQTKVDTIAA